MRRLDGGAGMKVSARGVVISDPKGDMSPEIGEDRAVSRDTSLLMADSPPHDPLFVTQRCFRTPERPRRATRRQRLLCILDKEEVLQNPRLAAVDDDGDDDD